MAVPTFPAWAVDPDGSTKARVRLPRKVLRRLDVWYADTDPDTRIESWSRFVYGIAAVRRAVVAGVTVKVGRTTLRTHADATAWAEERYPALPEGRPPRSRAAGEE